MGGLLAQPSDVGTAAATLSSAVSPIPGLGAERSAVVSRSDSRGAADPTKAAALGTAGGPAIVKSQKVSLSDPRSIARGLLADFGFSSSQFGCLDAIWSAESGWRVSAANPTSAAYGIPQANPGSKMASAGADWRTNPITQIRWGLGYIRDRYGSPCAAWSYKRAHGFY